MEIIFICVCNVYWQDEYCDIYSIQCKHTRTHRRIFGVCGGKRAIHKSHWLSDRSSNLIARTDTMRFMRSVNTSIEHRMRRNDVSKTIQHNNLEPSEWGSKRTERVLVGSLANSKIVCITPRTNVVFIMCFFFRFLCCMCCVCLLKLTNTLNLRAKCTNVHSIGRAMKPNFSERFFCFFLAGFLLSRFTFSVCSVRTAVCVLCVAPVRDRWVFAPLQLRCFIVLFTCQDYINHIRDNRRKWT